MSRRPFYRKKRYYVLALLIGFMVFAYNFLNLRLSDAQLAESLANNALGLQPTVDYFEVDGRRLRFVSIGQEDLPLVLLLHGAPSSSAFWRGFMRDSLLLTKMRFVAMDRPGYGFSGIGRPETSVARQSAAVGKLLEKLRPKADRIIVHGSSYGGTLAARVAMDFPDLIDGLLLQSASVKPGAEKILWITYPTTHWSLRWLVPGAIRSANAEKLSHTDQLLQMANGWSNICVPSIILHGSEDWLIYPDNADYACQQLINAPVVRQVMAPGRGHDLLWTEPDLIKQSLHQLIHWTTAPVRSLAPSLLSAQ